MLDTESPHFLKHLEDELKSHAKGGRKIAAIRVEAEEAEGGAEEESTLLPYELIQARRNAAQMESE